MCIRDRRVTAFRAVYHQVFNADIGEGATGHHAVVSAAGAEGVEIFSVHSHAPVSYTHLDVYKRQVLAWCGAVCAPAEEYAFPGEREWISKFGEDVYKRQI